MRTAVLARNQYPGMGYSTEHKPFEPRIDR
jgi:hypothetical protein